MTPAPTLSPAPSVSVAPSLSLPPGGGIGGGACVDYGAFDGIFRNDGTLNIAAESSVVLGKGINIDAKDAKKSWAILAGSGTANCFRDTVDTFVTINGTVAESKYGHALIATDGTAVTMCDGHLQGGLHMPGPGYLQMACGSILAGSYSSSEIVPFPAVRLQDTLFKSNITGGNIIGGHWSGDHYWGKRGPSMFIGTYDQDVDFMLGRIVTPLSVHVNIFGGTFEGNWDLYPKSVINVHGYDLELSDDNEMPCPSYFHYSQDPPDTTTCRTLTGYLCDDSPINVKIRFISGESNSKYIDINKKGEVNVFNDVNCKTVVPEIDGCGMQKCKKKSAKSGKQVPKKSDKSGKENMFG